MKLKITNNSINDTIHYWLWCPACDDVHMVNNGWGFNGDEEKPTFTPSILVHSITTLDNDDNKIQTPTCHSFVTDGMWNYLGDCTHEMAGKSVPLVELPSYFHID